MPNPQNQSIVAREPQNVARVEQRASVRPACDVYENVDEYLVVADMPGVTRDALTIQVEQSEMIIEAHSKAVQSAGRAISTEFVPCDYRRRFALPAAVEAGRVQAELRDGVLRIHLPKAESAKPRQIPIH